MHFVGTNYTNTVRYVIFKLFHIRKDILLGAFKIVIYSEQCSSTSTESARFLITNHLLNVVLDISPLILPPISSTAHFLQLVAKKKNSNENKECRSNVILHIVNFCLKWVGAPSEKTTHLFKFPDMIKVIHQNRWSTRIAVDANTAYMLWNK